MTGFFLRRFARIGLTAWLGVTLVFLALRLAGDPALQLAGMEATPADVAQLRSYLNLDEPLWRQYLTYLSNVVTGDFGASFRDGQPALGVIAERLPATLLLGGVSFLWAFLVGGALGLWAALRRDSWIDRGVVGLAVATHAIPNFFTGILLIFVFGYLLQWLPGSGASSPRHFILPALTLGLAWMGIIARLVRASVLDVLGAKYILAARARGLSQREVLGHVLRNAAVPTVLISGLVAGGIAAGAVVTETIFAWPGIGRCLMTAVLGRDLPVVQAGLIVVILAMALTNFASDLVAASLDPRLRAA